jgi:hypothetical protein
VQFDTRADGGREYDRRIVPDWWLARKEGLMFDWMNRRGSTASNEAKPQAEAATRHRGKEAGKYRLLYEYLQRRYADTVVLTFGQIEDLLGFALPDPARTAREWWTIADMSTAEARCSDAWTLANRTASPNLLAQTVVFERVS